MIDQTTLGVVQILCQIRGERENHPYLAFMRRNGHNED